MYKIHREEQHRSNEINKFKEETFKFTKRLPSRNIPPSPRGHGQQQINEL